MDQRQIDHRTHLNNLPSHRIKSHIWRLSRHLIRSLHLQGETNHLIFSGRITPHLATLKFCRSGVSGCLIYPFTKWLSQSQSQLTATNLSGNGDNLTDKVRVWWSTHEVHGWLAKQICYYCWFSACFSGMNNICNLFPIPLSCFLLFIFFVFVCWRSVEKNWDRVYAT